MAALARRSQRSTNIWPGFVDALATLLMVLVFLLMIFVLAQFFLNEAITGRDTALEKLQNQVNELADLLALERTDSKDLRLNVTQLAEELQASVALRDDLNTTIESLTIRAEGAEKAAAGAEAKVERLSKGLEDAFKTIEADKAKIQVQLRELAVLSQQVAALRSLKDELEKEVVTLSGKLGESQTKFAREREISESARAQLALLNRQMAALRDQLKVLSAALDASEKVAKEQKVQISSMGRRLNAALASRVQELSRYRSEFFGRLRQVLGNRPGIRVVGDRFVFQSEVLFASGSTELGAAGRAQMAQLAETLRDIAASIPKEINWVLRIDGHTDKIPINTLQFPSNWELSAGRAISVVKFLLDQGIPANRLAATGFGEHQPLDPRDDEIALRRNRRIELKLTQR